MKNTLIAISLIFSTAAWACPGAHLMTFRFLKTDAFLLNMQDGKMSRVDTNQDVALLSLKVNDSEVCNELPRSRSKCSDMLLYLTIFGTKKIDTPLYNQKIKVEVSLTDGHKVKTATVSQFPGRARGMGCGPVYVAK